MRASVARKTTSCGCPTEVGATPPPESTSLRAEGWSDWVCRRRRGRLGRRRLVCRAGGPLPALGGREGGRIRRSQAERPSPYCTSRVDPRLRSARLIAREPIELSTRRGRNVGSIVLQRSRNRRLFRRYREERRIRLLSRRPHSSAQPRGLGGGGRRDRNGLETGRPRGSGRVLGRVGDTRSQATAERAPRRSEHPASI